MTQVAINKQIEVIKSASAKAQQTQESALRFLKDAGIFKGEKPHISTSTKSSSTKK